MAQIPGSVPLTGKVAPTDDTDTFATHVDIYGEGGYMTVADIAERDAITSERRKQGMAVFVNDTNEMYILQDGVANSDWELFSGGGGGDLQAVVEAGGIYLGDENKTKEFNVNVNTLPTTNRFAVVKVEVEEGNPAGGGGNSEENPAARMVKGPPSSSGKAEAILQAVGQDDDNPVQTLVMAGKYGTSGFVSNMLSLNARVGMTQLTSWNRMNIDAENDIRIRTDVGEIYLMAGQDGEDSAAEIMVASTGDIRVDGMFLRDPNVGDALVARNTDGCLEWQPGVKSVRVELTSAEILNLGSTFKEIIPNPGAGKFIQILSIYTLYSFKGTAYTGQSSDNIFIRYGAYGPGISGYSTVTLIPFSSGLNATTDKLKDWLAGPIDWKDDSNVELWMFSGNTLATGNGEVTVYASYMIKELDPSSPSSGGSGGGSSSGEQEGGNQNLA